MGRTVKLTNVYGADLETDHDDWHAWIVQWAISTGDSEYTGTDLTSFFNRCLHIVHQKQTLVVYFHNIRYDGEFLKAGFKALEKAGWDHKYIVRNGQIIKIRLDNPVKKQSIEFRDTLLKVPGSSVRSLGKMIGLPKLDPPGTETFEPGWSERLDLSEGSADWEYVKRDARIVARTARDLHRKGFTRATLSGDAWKCAKTMLGTSDGKDHGPGANWKWDYMMPSLSPELDAKLRRGYWGGINISDNQGVNQSGARSIVHEDIHNSYGAVMRYDPMPYGRPSVTHDWPADHCWWIGEIMVKLKLKDGLIPWFQFKNAIDCLLEGWKYGTLVKETQVFHVITLTSVDLAVLDEWYDIEVAPPEIFEPTFWIFTTRQGFLDPYID